jgi:DNA mismatch endonuclease, patch repair protein
MSRIKSRGNASTELKFMRLLRRQHVTGWRRHLKVFGIRPDFVFKRIRTAVFIDGCFWHGCPTHCNVWTLEPYWRDKIVKNGVRDVRQEIILHEAGWNVRRIWEHDLKGVR